MKNLVFLLSIIIVFLSSCQKHTPTSFKEQDLILIPKPKSLKINAGSFKISPETRFSIPNDSLKPLTSTLNSLFKKAAGFKMHVSKEPIKKNSIGLKINSKLQGESYKLSVTEKNVVLESNSRLGFVYGLETIRQLLPKEIESPTELQNKDWRIPNVDILDEPQYTYRGCMLDVSRHFFEKDYIKKHIDRMAFLKLNTLHLHLVDDQGWRIEIKAFPKLTEVGGFRVNQEDKPWNKRAENNPEDKAGFGGFYSQEDIKEIVEYAQEKGISIIPEIEMPAHVMSAIAAYPWLSCSEKPIAVPSGGVWPITTIYCAGKDSTFEFLEQVLTEIIELFPGEYIHVGGDEATKTNWMSCPNCQKRMKQLKLSNEDELQSYFMRRIEKFLNKNGKKLIGWDEILEGGLPKEATVMSWRGFEGGWKASSQGHDVIMTPTSHLYFDYYQGNPDYEPLAFNGYTPLSRVYDFRPVLDSMSVEQKQHVLGGQANLWSEYIPTIEHSEYMLFPRLAAFAEVVWSPENTLDWEDFSLRIQKAMQRFDLMGINYAKSSFIVQADSKINIDTKEINIKLQTEFPDSKIKYALDEFELNKTSNTYKAPINLKESSRVKAAAFKNGKIIEPIFDKEFEFHKGVAKSVFYSNRFNDAYKGGGDKGLVDVLRGSKNFRDNRWQGWINKPAIVVIDLEEPTNLKEVIVGSLQEQGAGIYFPKQIKVEVSQDGIIFKEVGIKSPKLQENSGPKIKNFVVKFDHKPYIQYVKVTVEPLNNNPKGGSSWVFLDEIILR